jgi:hypothetical protein
MTIAQLASTNMDIRFISSLTPEDESRLAQALIGAVEKLLDPFPIWYTIHIETATNQVFDHHHTPTDAGSRQEAADPRRRLTPIDRISARIHKM